VPNTRAQLPLLVKSPFARSNCVDHLATDQSSILRFIEDNWNLGRIANGLADGISGKLDGMFDFGDGSPSLKLFLDSLTGRPLD
jgi:phospholipase C